MKSLLLAQCSLLGMPSIITSFLILIELLASMAAAQEMKMHINPARHNAVITHGTFMGFAFAFLFPLGAIIIRTASFRGLVWVHAGVQLFAYILALTGLGLGVYIAVYPESQVRLIILFPLLPLPRR